MAKVGDDEFGQQALTQLQAEGVDTRWVSVAPGQPSGVALINVTTITGENSIRANSSEEEQASQETKWEAAVAHQTG